MEFGLIEGSGLIGMKFAVNSMRRFFGDGKGEFGSEKEAVDEEGPIYNIFRKFVKGNRGPADRRS